MMRIRTVIFSIIFLLNFLSSCEVKQQTKNNPTKTLGTGAKAAETEVVCIKDIYISTTSPTEEGPDGFVIVIYSSNVFLNQALDSAQVSKLLYWQKSSTSSEDSVTIQSHHVRKIKLGENQYKLYFPTMHFRFNSSGEVTTTHEDLKKDAKIEIFSKQNKMWEIRICP